MSLSVIIPYHNENKNIKFTLDQISNQTLKPDEIILVNSNSSDNSSQIVNDYISRNNLNIKNYDTKLQTPSEAKNFGINKSSSTWLAFMDCDMFFPLNWLESQMSLSRLNNSKKIFFGMAILKGSNLIDKCSIAQTYGLNKPNPTIPSSLVHKSVFTDDNLFLNARSHYDSYWIKNNLNKSFSIINPNVLIEYLGINYSNSYINLFKKSFYYSLSLIDVYPLKSLLLFTFFISLLFFSILSKSIFVFFFISYFVLRICVIPLIKSRNIKLLKNLNYNIHVLLFAGLVIDFGKAYGIFISILKKNKLFSSYFNNHYSK